MCLQYASQVLVRTDRAIYSWELNEREGQICAVPSQQYSVTHLRLIKKWWKGVSGESMSFGSLCQATLIRLKILSKGLFADAKLDDNLGAKASLSDELHAKDD